MWRNQGESEKESTRLRWIYLPVLPVCFLCLVSFHSICCYQYQLWEAGISISGTKQLSCIPHIHIHTHTHTHTHSSRQAGTQHFPSLAAEHMIASWHNTEPAEHVWRDSGCLWAAAVFSVRPSPGWQYCCVGTVRFWHREYHATCKG